MATSSATTTTGVDGDRVSWSMAHQPQYYHHHQYSDSRQLLFSAMDDDQEKERKGMEKRKEEGARLKGWAGGVTEVRGGGGMEKNINGKGGLGDPRGFQFSLEGIGERLVMDGWDARDTMMIKKKTKEVSSFSSAASSASGSALSSSSSSGDLGMEAFGSSSHADHYRRLCLEHEEEEREGGGEAGGRPGGGDRWCDERDDDDEDESEDRLDLNGEGDGDDDEEAQWRWRKIEAGGAATERKSEMDASASSKHEEEAKMRRRDNDEDGRAGNDGEGECRCGCERRKGGKNSHLRKMYSVDGEDLVARDRMRRCVGHHSHQTEYTRSNGTPTKEAEWKDEGEIPRSSTKTRELAREERKRRMVNRRRRKREAFPQGPRLLWMLIWPSRFHPRVLLPVIAAAILACMLVNMWVAYSVYSSHYHNAERIGFQANLNRKVTASSKSLFSHADSNAEAPQQATGNGVSESNLVAGDDDHVDGDKGDALVAAIAFQAVVDDLVEKIDDLGQTVRLLVQEQLRSEIQAGDAQPVKKHSIALIAPVTSKGYENNPQSMPLIKVSLRSLCDTASSSYRYTYFLCYTDGDPVFGDQRLVADLFDRVKDECPRWRRSDLKIDFVVVSAGKRVTAKRGLSILFNLPTLRAYAEGYEYYYLINDDLRFVTDEWTEMFVHALATSPVFPNFGITGGLDVSSPQQFLEFPFFHRTHVDILGDEAPAHPYLFHNWWEDNWMNDLYLTWNSTFYLDHVVVRNYDGLEYGVTEQGGAVEPKRYEARHDLPPVFYISEVERGRAKIKKWLEHKLPSAEEYPMRNAVLGVEIEYCRREGETLTLYERKEINPCRGVVR